MLLIPAIDLRNGKCVRLAQGRKDSAVVYSNNPVDVARGFENDGARMLHVVDLDAAFAETGSPNREVLRELAGAIHIPIQFGGGLRTCEDVEAVMNIGVARVVIGTAAVESFPLLQEMVQRFQAGIVVGIDARDGEVVTRGWETAGAIRAVNLARQVAEIGVERIVYTDVRRDGMLSGINVEQTCMVAEASGLKITASGGVSSIDDVKKLSQFEHFGIDSVIVGKALYEGKFRLKDVISTHG
jgi:phosphoribosylformimino-5-aminoimidazole carboxamide ribotide isomerase